MAQSILERKQWLLEAKQFLAPSKFFDFKSILIIKIFFSAETEVWEFETGTNNIIGATLENNYYAYGIGLYAVNFDFCRK